MCRRISTIHRRLSLLGLVLGFVLFAGNVSAQADIYTGLAALSDTLRAWETQPPIPDASVLEPLSLEELFTGAEITSIEEGRRIVLPPLYGEQFSASLWVEGTYPKWVFSVTMEQRDSLVVLDGRIAEGLPADTTRDALYSHVRQTLVALRTLAVPGERARPVFGRRAVPVTVKLMGRDVDMFSYEDIVWWRCMQRLAQGMLVYAFLLEIEVEGEDVGLNWVVFLTAPDQQMQHLIHIHEGLVLGAEPTVKEHEVRLVPGLRLDNLEQLFARMDRSSASRHKMYLNRP